MQLLEGVKMLAAQGGGWSIQVLINQCSVADPGVGIFLILLIRDPDPGWNKIQIQDPESYFLRTLYQCIGLKILKFSYADPKPGSGIFSTLHPGPG
jgi:hypothetical protein